MVLVSLGIGWGRLVGIVRIVEMKPNEAWTRRMRGHPRFRMLHHLQAPSFHSSPARLRLRMLREVVIEIESAIQARRQCFAVENDRPNKRGCGIAVLLQQLRQ